MGLGACESPQPPKILRRGAVTGQQSASAPDSPRGRGEKVKRGEAAAISAGDQMKGVRVTRSGMMRVLFVCPCLCRG